MPQAMEAYNRWLAYAHLDEQTRAELEAIRNNPQEIADRFWRGLSFGTGGLRGIMGAGTNRVNAYTVAKVTRGFAKYLNSISELPSCAIGHDSRHGSRAFAQLAAAVLALALPIMGIGFRPSLLALTVLAVLPIFINTFVGIMSADPAVVDAARGMGASDFQLLRMVQLPLAMPFMFAGLQTAVVQSIGLATLAAYIGGGGFGNWILQGLAVNSFPLLLAGAVPVAVMAMFAEILLGLARRAVVPKGLTVA